MEALFHFCSEPYAGEGSGRVFYFHHSQKYSSDIVHTNRPTVDANTVHMIYLFPFSEQSLQSNSELNF